MPTFGFAAGYQEIGNGLTADGAEIWIATGAVVTPGLVNTITILYQTLTRAVPAAQDACFLAGCRRSIRSGRGSARGNACLGTIGLAELALSGCTMSSDHLYLFPNGARLDDTIDAAARSRASLSPDAGRDVDRRKRGGLPPDSWSKRSRRS